MTVKRTIAIGIVYLLTCIFVISLCGCASQTLEDENVQLEDIKEEKRSVELYIKSPQALGKYEPMMGIYSGAYIEKDVAINGDLLKYEKLVGQEQTFKVFQYNAEERLASTEILRCIAQQKVPYIKVLMPVSGDLTPLYRFIVDLRSSYEVPIFVELFPLTTHIEDAVSYKKTYRRAVELLHKYLKDVTVVWSVDESRVYEMPLFYPGDDYVDWAGINIYIPRYKYNEPYVYGGEETFDFWYKSFQQKKPMMISSLGISHFSRIDHTYKVYDVAKRLSYFYETLPAEYPRLKGIIYADVDLAEVYKDGKEDYSITDQEVLVDQMKQTFNALQVHAKLEQAEETYETYMKYTVETSFIENTLYVPRKYMKYLFKEIPLNKIKATVSTDGEKIYSIEEIHKYTDCYYKD